ncbi:MAG: hypothetical protein MJY61_06165 [Bacteroidales bacterium]|nr:hypothetical protein [Bacteroidales bacterium]
MADNYLEKRYRDVFGQGSAFNAETGYNEPRRARPAIPKLPRTKKSSGPSKTEKQ